MSQVPSTSKAGNTGGPRPSFVRICSYWSLTIARKDASKKRQVRWTDSLIGARTESVKRMGSNNTLPTSDSEKLVKVVLELDECDWHEHKTESMWAKSLGHNRYQLRNVPFYAYGVSYDDVVIAKPIQGLLVVQGISQPSGHSTYRLFLGEDI